MTTGRVARPSESSLKSHVYARAETDERVSIDVPVATMREESGSALQSSSEPDGRVGGGVSVIAGAPPVEPEAALASAIAAANFSRLST